MNALNAEKKFAEFLDDRSTNTPSRVGGKSRSTISSEAWMLMVGLLLAVACLIGSWPGPYPAAATDSPAKGTSTALFEQPNGYYRSITD